MSLFVTAKRLGALAACAAALAISAAPSVASADTHWVVNGTFDDGGTLSGFFDINVYGYLENFDVLTTAGSVEGGHDYTPADYFSNGSDYVDFAPGYFNALHIQFTGDLGTPSPSNLIIGGFQGPSYECVGSWSCYVPDTTYGGSIRYLSGSASALGGAVPEPAAWALMLVGFGGLGAALRSARRYPARATA